MTAASCEELDLPRSPHEDPEYVFPGVAPHVDVRNAEKRWGGESYCTGFGLARTPRGAVDSQIIACFLNHDWSTTYN